MKPTITKQEIDKIIQAVYHDPFDILGIHKKVIGKKQVVVIRAFVPHARKISVIKKGEKKKTAMELIHPDGLFEAVFKEAQDVFFYQLEITFKNGYQVVRDDPYSFLPMLGDTDLFLFGEGNNHRIYEKFGAHLTESNGVKGVLFAVWAPSAERVSVIGDFNGWDGRCHPMRVRGSSGVWEIFIPGVGEGEHYKFEIRSRQGAILVKSDPYAFYTEFRPKTANIVHDINKYRWSDKKWMDKRKKIDQMEKPLSIYEVHLGSWMRVMEENNRFLTYREMAPKLVEYVKEMGFTHLELLPIAEHPLDASWGYQVTQYFAPTSRFGPPEDFMYLVDLCHQNDIGVIVDWVAGHFPKDGHGLMQFDGSCLYEHADPRQGEHADWGTLIFNYGRNEVRNFLLSNLLFWLDKYHIDGVRVDAVASMLYQDYSRKEGEWIPNKYGGRENLEAIDFLKEMNKVAHNYYPGMLSFAEESTAWPGVSHPTYLGGLGFGYKWNMGWMNDILEYFSQDPLFRKYHHNNLTFAMLYAFHENFVLVLSHDEVVHGKRSLLDKMPGEGWEKFANLRLLFGYMYSQPGKKLLFMGGEFGHGIEWNFDQSLDWHLLGRECHNKLRRYVKDLNRLYKKEKAFWEVDFNWTGFEWIDFHDWENSTITFIRRSKDPKDYLVFAFNFTPVTRQGYRLGVPDHCYYEEIFNSDSTEYWGKNIGNFGGMDSQEIPHHGRPYSLEITLPPLATVIFKPRRD